MLPTIFYERIILDQKKDSKNLNIIGYTGKKDILNYKNLLFEDLNQITASYAIFASKKMSSDKFSEIHVILSEAQKNQTVIDSYKKDFLTPVSLNTKQSSDWYENQRKFWNSIINDIN